MKNLRLISLVLLPAVLTTAPMDAQLTMPHQFTDAINHMDDTLTYQSPDGRFYSHVGGEVDVTQYHLDGQPFGLLFSNPSSPWLLAPRLTLNFDAAYGERLSLFAKFRWDSGFDPGEQNNDARIDEIYLRGAVIPQHLDLEAGKLATVFGGYIGRNEPWQNPFITAPLPYDQVTSVHDASAPANANLFAGIRNARDNNSEWVPVIWGPSYSPSAAAFGTWGPVDLAVQGSSQALSSRPSTWDYLDFSRPTFTGRLGYRIDPAWNFGISGSVGPYLDSEAAGSLPPNTMLKDYDQIVVGGDASWAWHDWLVSGEFIYNRFEVPNVGNADVFSWYGQVKYQLTSQLYAAARWNQQVYNQVNTSTGPQNWDNNEMRMDMSLGYKWDTHVETKLQYSWQHQEASFQNGRNLIALQMVIRF